MFALTDISRSAQRFVCMALATVIVATGLFMGIIAADSASQPNYSVTITQVDAEEVLTASR